MCTLTFGATIPIKSLISSFGILKVNNEGTGFSTSRPISKSHCKPSIFGLPPDAIINLSTKTSLLIIYPFSSGLIFLTGF